MLLWLRNNLAALLLAFVLAVTVWVIAINSADPTEERTYPNPVPIEFVDLPEGLLLVGESPREGLVTLQAPRSIWNLLTDEDIRLGVPLTGLHAGTHRLTLEAVIDRRPSRVTAIEPPEITLTLESAATRETAIEVETIGSPPLGFEAGYPVARPGRAVVHGPVSAVTTVARLLATVDLSGRRTDMDETVRLLPVDEQGRLVAGVAADPETCRVSVRVQQLGGFRDVAVKVVIEGQLDAGYRLTNVTVSPPIVTVFSADPLAVEALPGFVETVPLDLSAAHDDIERRLSLDLPDGISPVGDQSVLVQVSIAAIETSRTITRTLEIQGLGAGLQALPAPDSVSLILTGPLPTLDKLSPEDVRVVLDLLGLGAGTHQVTPTVTILPADVVVETILPASVEVVITGKASTTPTPTP